MLLRQFLKIANIQFLKVLEFVFQDRVGTLKMEYWSLSGIVVQDGKQCKKHCTYNKFDSFWNRVGRTRTVGERSLNNRSWTFIASLFKVVYFWHLTGAHCDIVVM